MSKRKKKIDNVEDTRMGLMFSALPYCFTNARSVLFQRNTQPRLLYYLPDKDH